MTVPSELVEESCPPERQSTFTGVPLAAMPLALASAWASGNSEASSPWLSRGGAVILASTVDGLEAVEVRIA